MLLSRAVIEFDYSWKAVAKRNLILNFLYDLGCFLSFSLNLGEFSIKIRVYLNAVKNKDERSQKTRRDNDRIERCEYMPIH